MTILATDPLINAGGSVDITTYSGNWTYAVSGPPILVDSVGTRCSLSASTIAGAFWNAVTWPADQWSQATLATSVGGSTFMGLGLRMNAASGGNFYFFWVEGGGSQFYGVGYALNGALNYIQSPTAFTANIGDVFYFSVQGTTLTALRNGSLVYTTTDSNLATGSAGIAGSPNAGTATSKISTWSGGGLAGSPPYYYRKNVLYFT
jgi:hypothetical protein